MTLGDRGKHHSRAAGHVSLSGRAVVALHEGQAHHPSRQAFGGAATVKPVLMSWLCLVCLAGAVVLVGHSFGGLVAKAALTLRGLPRDAVRLIVTLGSPHQR